MSIALHNISACKLNFTEPNRLPEYGCGRRQFVLCRDETMWKNMEEPDRSQMSI
jgi:hypothetical protein